MNKDFAYCMGKVKVKIVGTETIFEQACMNRKTCKRHIPVWTDNHFSNSDIPPKGDYLCWVNAHECAKRDYVLYLKNDKEN